MGVTFPGYRDSFWCCPPTFLSVILVSLAREGIGVFPSFTVRFAATTFTTIAESFPLFLTLLSRRLIVFANRQFAQLGL